jgi:hypothetical protein
MQISGITGLLHRVHRADLFVLAVAITAPTARAHRLSPALAEFNHLRAVIHPPQSPPITPHAAQVSYSTSFAQCGQPTYDVATSRRPRAAALPCSARKRPRVASA